MKLKKVASICGQAGRFYLMDQSDKNGEVVCQWLGDGCAAYPIAGLPYMDMDNICAMFDIPEKKQEKCILRHNQAPGGICWEDADPKERQLDDPDIRVRYEGRELLPLHTSRGMIFIREQYLLPLDRLDYMRLYERESKDGTVYVVAKVGMIIQAVIMPTDVVTDSFVDKMDELTRMCHIALTKKSYEQAAERAERDVEQDTLFQYGEDVREGAGE